MRPSSSVSAYSRMSDSGVRSSCDTLDTKSDFSRASATSLLTLRYVSTSPPISSSDRTPRMMKAVRDPAVVRAPPRSSPGT